MLLAGIAAYRRHSYRRDLPDPPCLWAEGDSRLLDYGQAAHPAMLFVPSLVNRAQVLDLMPNRSLLRYLAAHDLRPLLLDWGWPTETERRFDLTTYIVGRLERAMMAAGTANGGRKLVLVGYCMGGLLAIAAALRRPEMVRALVLLATPWDFHRPDAEFPMRLGSALPGLEPVLQATGTLPIDALQMLFSAADPQAVPRKYRAFARLPADSDRARLFVALEDWLNDGVPLAAPVARECLGGWYGRNEPMRGQWRVAGEVVEPHRLSVPSFVVVPGRDRVVPPSSALPLADRIPGAVLHRPVAGHVGMVAGSGAEAALWHALRNWVQALPSQG